MSHDLDPTVLAQLADAPEIAIELDNRLKNGYRIRGYLLADANGDCITVEKQPRQPTMVEGIWRITNHICRRWVCGGRILERMDIRAGGLFRCSRCGVTSTELIEAICSCGQRLQENKDLGVRCFPNPSQDDEHPWEVVYSIQSPEPTVGPGLPVTLPGGQIKRKGDKTSA